MKAKYLYIKYKREFDLFMLRQTIEVGSHWSFKCSSDFTGKCYSVDARYHITITDVYDRFVEFERASLYYGDDNRDAMELQPFLNAYIPIRKSVTKLGKIIPY